MQRCRPRSTADRLSPQATDGANDPAACQRAPGAHLVAHLGEERLRPRIAGILDDKPQRPIEILSGAEHDRQLPGHLAERGLADAAAPAKLDMQQLGEPVFLLDSNPTVERIARLIFEYASTQGLPVVRVKVWETPTSFAEYTAGS